MLDQATCDLLHEVADLCVKFSHFAYDPLDRYEVTDGPTSWTFLCGRRKSVAVYTKWTLMTRDQLSQLFARRGDKGLDLGIQFNIESVHRFKDALLRKLVLEVIADA